MVMTEHTHKAFDADLQELVRMIAEMGGLAERLIGDAIDALNRHDTVLSQSIIADDSKIDLRDIVGALRVSNDLERIGDLAKNIAKRVMVLDTELNLQKVMRGVEHMAELVLTQIKDVLDAYSRRDVAKALAVWRGDEEVDAVNNSLFRELLTYMMEDPRNISVCIHLLFCAKNIERMGDHATNIAETIYYMVEGKPLPDERPKGDNTATTRVPFHM
jgi:phosphate transport system protein